MAYTSDKPQDDLHGTGCRRYRVISRTHPTATAEGADRVSAPHGVRPFADDTSTARATAFAKIRACVGGTQLAAAQLR